ncbi:ATP-dependent RNA helicase DBP10, putative [Plasmodium berghei]|uniref:RNA helicase n=2 Tax=Plasmodium berghei TaxID=5821 RepID=A0A509AFP5_PLABA|nr:ATP-dependent RNA helicase DBP10, putative [Plasmodium berghei ANKA]CXI23161.1 ATP-dependent RNA helicase DBP10, putative [Plasmodium berghei]SCM20168.1 ATP-dependent RNA helicase DBP10, putative [Plasmodium berghei]SCN23802.1 ATP-dependent RNA helicase DBP10, putative [Plasmodium berghei]SCO59245.1 ATP-dependent RNA helicase DBP10, putative [Plasmodium berghei]SCO60182.1 ATP-dependent RNA helicase DBP10, putative [Plasmodium berghei]|eukprot:XP_034420783.1 ATP-dependent RNA helicase DBP10, putative [Plasmodium berghei ANKA]
MKLKKNTKKNTLKNTKKSYVKKNEKGNSSRRSYGIGKKTSNKLDKEKHINKLNKNRAPNSKKKYSWLFDKNENIEKSDNDENEPKKGIKKKFVLYKNRKKKGKVVLSCFQNLGLSKQMCKSISTNLKYNRPTNIQKLCIPKILNKKDVICISETGSGKSLVYLSTLIDMLKDHNKFFGIRGLIILPTKELVIQIYKLAKKICTNYFNLKINIIIGGISLCKQFEILKENIDILICTPGRFSYILDETKLSLEKVEMIIIDEADRLLELNYYNDMNNIYKCIGNKNLNKQTILVSATLPTNVENYFKLKLNNPEIVFVNSDNNISSQINLHFLFCRSYEKYAILIKLILLFKQQKLGKTIIFFCTKYHILFFSKILNFLKINHSILYGNSDTSFRFNQINNFTKHEDIQFLLVTDLASRGIHIPSVQNVINYNLPFSPKIFLHRIGRACRTECQSGYGISIVTYQDILYAYEICFFIGKKLKFIKKSTTNSIPHLEQNTNILKEEIETSKNEIINNGKENSVYLGAIQNISEYLELIDHVKKIDSELISLNKSIDMSYKLYYSMRPKVSKYASTKFIKKIKKIGGIYKLCLLNHPNPIYDIPENIETKKNKRENKNDEVMNEIDNVFENLTNYLKNNTNSQKNEQNIIDSNNINMDNPNNTYESDHIKNESQNRLNNESNLLEAYKDMNINQQISKNFPQNYIESFLHEFQYKNNTKLKNISEEIKEKLDKLKEKIQKNKNIKNNYMSNDINGLLETITLGLNNEEIQNWENEELEYNNNFDKTNILDEEKNKNEKKKKLSKRAQKKLEKKKNTNQLDGIQKKKDISLDEILKKINDKKMKRDSNNKILELNAPGFDLLPDEEEELNKQRFVKKQIWDKKKNKFVLTEVDKFQDKKINKKMDAKPTSDKNTTSIYQKWVKRTKNRIKNVGELEDNYDNNKRNKIKEIFIENQKTYEQDMKQTNLKVLKETHPEITEALSKNIKLTKKQQRIYKKYITGKYNNQNTNELKTLNQIQQDKKKQLKKRLKTDRNFRAKYSHIMKKKHQQKLEKIKNLKSARSRSLAIVRKKIEKK